MADTTKELTVDEELDLMMGQMFSVRTNKPEKKEEEEPVDEKKIVSKRDKSKMKDARRKSKQGR